jgi:hypothetical protein
MSSPNSFEDLCSIISLEKNFEQANHNSNVANYLYKTSKLNANDWSLTISYYSVIHLFEYFLKKTCPILKLHNKEAKVSSLSDIIEKLCDNGNVRQKHLVRQKIVENNFSRIGGSWKYLSKGAYNSRYNCHIISKEMAKIALTKMEEIKRFFVDTIDKEYPKTNTHSS